MAAAVVELAIGAGEEGELDSFTVLMLAHLPPIAEGCPVPDIDSRKARL